MNFGHKVAIVIMLSFCQFANAGTKIFGFEVGVTTSEQVISAYTDSGFQLMRVHSEKSSLSGGRRLSPVGSYKVLANIKLPEPEDTDIEYYLFDEKDRLAGIFLELGFGAKQYSSIYEALAAKYKLVSKNDLEVLFKSADTSIGLSKGKLRYLRTDLFEKAMAKAAEDRRRTAAKF